MDLLLSLSIRRILSSEMRGHIFSVFRFCNIGDRNETNVSSFGNELLKFVANVVLSSAMGREIKTDWRPSVAA
jgi:hypothetical protein